MKKRHLLMAAGFLAVGITAAIAAGNWPTLPIVGEGSFCASTVSGTTLPSTQGGYGVVPGSTFGTGSSICGQTVPAGPTALTGNELIPADTGLLNGQPPATVTIPMPLAASGAYLDDVENSYTFTAKTIPNNINTYIVDTTTTVAHLSLTMPAAPINGQLLRVSSLQTITALQMISNTGQFISGTLPTALTPASTSDVGYSWIWNAPSSAWMRIQ